jgi:hypothetical protein
MPPLPPRGPLAGKRAVLGDGPRAAWFFAARRSPSGRRIPVHFFGAGRARSTLLAAGCVNGRRCAGQQAVAAAQQGCPPDDAELWLLPTLRPEGADLDVRRRAPGAGAFRQAVADLRPRHTVVYRTGPRAVVLASGAGMAVARRYARMTGLPLEAAGGGLAGWTQQALPGGAAFTVELSPERLGHAEADLHGNALLQLTGTRFARPLDAPRVRP